MIIAAMGAQARGAICHPLLQYTLPSLAGHKIWFCVLLAHDKFTSRIFFLPWKKIFGRGGYYSMALLHFLVITGEDLIVNNSSDSHPDVGSKCIQLQRWANSIPGTLLRILSSFTRNIIFFRKWLLFIMWKVFIDSIYFLREILQH